MSDYNALADRRTGKDIINDFKAGMGGDKLDIADLLDSVNHAGRIRSGITCSA